MSAFDGDDFREEAEEIFRTGFWVVGRAFNIQDAAPDLPYRFDSSSRNKAMSLLVQLVELMRAGAIEPNPLHAGWKHAQAARSDPTIQALIRRASKKTPIRARTGSAK